MAKEAGGVENLGFTRQDMKNKLYSKRSLKIILGVEDNPRRHRRSTGIFREENIRRREFFLFHSG
jgi:hypothetical protein